MPRERAGFDRHRHPWSRAGRWRGERGGTMIVTDPRPQRRFSASASRPSRLRPWMHTSAFGRPSREEKPAASTIQAGIGAEAGFIAIIGG